VEVVSPKAPVSPRWVAAILAGGLAVALVAASLAGLRVLGVAGSVRALEVAVSPGTDAPAPWSPFAGTPAEDFAEGAAGIVLPAAQPVPDGHLVDYRSATRDITAEEVAGALEQVRRALIAARLDASMLVDHDPEPLIMTLAPSFWRTWTDRTTMWGRRAREGYESPQLANRATKLAPDATLTAVPRVAGRITYRAATTFDGAPATQTRPFRMLEVVTRFVWVYALAVVHGVEGAVREGIVVVRDEIVWHVPADYRLLCCEPNLGVHWREAEARAWGADCDEYAEGLIRPARGPAAEIADVVFDPDQPLEPTAGCRPGE
jgi:hypothetical protein